MEFILKFLASGNDYVQAAESISPPKAFCAASDKLMNKELEIIFGVVVSFVDTSNSKAIESILEINTEELDHKKLYVISSMPRSVEKQHAVNTTIKLESKGIITRSVVHMYPDIAHLVEHEAFSKLRGATHLIKINQLVL